MRVCTYRTGDPAAPLRAGRLDADEVVPLDAPDVGALLDAAAHERVDWRAMAARDAGEPLAAASCDLAPLVPRPSKIVCVGHNYRGHVAEMGAELPTHPTLFAKFARALVGAEDPVMLPWESAAVDWEVEMAVVVGRTVRRADPRLAALAIAGYTVANDVTARDWQRRASQWLAGKTFEQTTPLGPALVSGDEVDHAADLALRCLVDGEVRQDSRTSDLLFSPAELIGYVSAIVTLDPGDVLLTGTPSGVGAGRTPPVYLAPGQVLRTEIEGLGHCENPCITEEER